MSAESVVMHFNRLTRKLVELPSLELFRIMRIWHLWIWFGGELGGAGLMVGFDDLRSLFEPKQFNDSVIS